MADLVSWRVIEQGWDVVAADGSAVGKIDQIVGDVEHDIFDGLTIGDGGTVLTRAKYVPSERVAEIREGVVKLALSAEEAAKLEPYVAPVDEPLAQLAPEPPPSGGRRPLGGSGMGALMRILLGRRL